MMLVSVWSVLLCAAVTHWTAVSGTEPRAGDGFRCCTPPQWTANVRVTVAGVERGVNKYDEVWMGYHYDNINQRVAYTDYKVNGQPVAQRMILDFAQHQWTVILNQRNCVVYSLSADMQPACTPTNISFVAFAVAPVISPLEGFYGNTVYYSGNDVAEGHMTVTVGSCALIEEAMFSQNAAGSVAQTLQYFNQTLSADASVFVVPSFCPQGVQASTSGQITPPHYDLLPATRRV